MKLRQYFSHALLYWIELIYHMFEGVMPEW